MAYRTYLVGGAVRDDLLKLEPRERDWVVVGGTPDELLERGFRQVGASFPVFLHPDSGEEYALARRERKQGHGYHGFQVDFHPQVTLEEDLSRRDLTINAMARGEGGELIDPYGGARDLQQRILRHVSPAFREDPLRVLRVARFAARFAPLGFTVHRETLELMTQMSASGELDHLVAERVWTEIADAMAGPRPSVFIEVLRSCGALGVLLPEVEALFGVPQPEHYHPEIDTGVHVLMAMEKAADEQAPAPVVFALLVHDLGKALTPRAEWPAHKRHEQRGLKPARALCDRLRVPVAWRDLALKVTALHLRCHQSLQMRPETVLKLLDAGDFLRRPEQLERFTLACRADYLGRKGLEDRPYPQAAFLRRALDSARSVQARDLDLEGLEGPAVGEKLRRARIEAIAGIANRGE